MAEDTNKFDAHIRSLLDNATEEVPDKVWLGIEKRLAETGTSGGTGKVRRIPLWLRISGAAAAAAAVAAGLFLTGTLDNAVSPGPDYLAADTGNGADFNIMTSSRTETGFPRIIMADIPEARPLAEDIFRKTGPIDARNAENAAEEDESGIMTEENTVSLGNEYRDSHDQAGAGNDVFESNDISESDEYKDLEQQDDLAAWAELLSEEDGYRRGRRISVTLSGNAISNTNASTSASGSSSIAFRPGKNSLTEDYISQTSESSYAIPLSFGAGVKIDFTERWSMSAGINYSMLGRTFAGNFFKVQDNGEFTENYFSNIRNRQDYIGIPVNVYFSILKGNFIDFYAYAGGTAEKCVSNRYNMSSEGTSYTHRENVKGLQFSANAGIGMEFIIADAFGIYIDPSLRYYFPDARQPQSIRKAQPLMFGLEMGFRVRL